MCLQCVFFTYFNLIRICPHTLVTTVGVFNHEKLSFFFLHKILSLYKNTLRILTV